MPETTNDVSLPERLALRLEVEEFLFEEAAILDDWRMDDELQMRAFWRQWAAQIEGRQIEDWDDAPPRVANASNEPTAPTRVGVAAR